MDRPLPAHYRASIRRLIRFAVVFWSAGLLLGIVSTEFNVSLRYTQRHDDPPRTLTREEGGRVKAELPPGFLWESGFDLRISHGHFVLIGGVIPLCVAAGLLLLHTAGGGEISAKVLTAFFWLYLIGATGALSLILYKGLASVLAVRAGNFDLADVHAKMFLGSRAVRGLAHALTHSILAAGVGLIAWAFWRSSGRISSGGTSSVAGSSSARASDARVPRSNAARRAFQGASPRPLGLGAKPLGLTPKGSPAASRPAARFAGFAARRPRRLFRSLSLAGRFAAAARSRLRRSPAAPLAGRAGCSARSRLPAVSRPAAPRGFAARRPRRLLRALACRPLRGRLRLAASPLAGRAGCTARSCLPAASRPAARSRLRRSPAAPAVPLALARRPLRGRLRARGFAARRPRRRTALALARRRFAASCAAASPLAGRAGVTVNTRSTESWASPTSRVPECRADCSRTSAGCRPRSTSPVVRGELLRDGCARAEPQTLSFRQHAVSTATLRVLGALGASAVNPLYPSS
ncbi:MAG: hypothetical protein R3F62_07555 [Planctomycetota bacterium]